jgi:DNA-binding CsgD family transcriptional regulator
MRLTPVSSDARQRTSDHSAQDQQPENRPPFVGREHELRQLQAAFHAAAAGDGALVMLVGEPGIGKTTVCDQLCRFVSASGGLSLVGHCYEEGSFRRPYQPFVEAFSTYLRECDTETLTTELGSNVAELASMVPMLRERLDVTPRPPGDPEEDRWRLLDAATDLLRAVGLKRPLLVVLEDLHDADRGTLDLLLHIARNLRGTRLLVVGTYRDVEVDRAHPLAAALTELHRFSNVARVQLHGLSTDEVYRLLAETSQHAIPRPFAELVHRQTEGNPLFVRETLRFVVDTGLMERRDGMLRRVGDQSLAGRIPEGLRDAVGKRLSRLSDSTNRVLSIASCIGREFQLDVLSQVVSCPEQELEDALDEASTAGIVEGQSVIGATIVYRFSHAFFRQTLYDEIMVPRRIRLHQQVARALEDVHARRLDEHSAELAEHYSYSSDAGDLAKAVSYGELAARRATEVFAYGEAARQLERALAVQDLVDQDDHLKRCDLLLALGDAQLPSGETERAIRQVAPEALSLAEALGDRSRAFRACRLAVDCLFAQGAGSTAGQPEYLTWAERACQYANPDSTERVHADIALAFALGNQGRRQEARVLRLESLARARELGDPEAFFRTALNLLSNSSPQDWHERVRLSVEAARSPRQWAGSQTHGQVLWYCGLVQLAYGQRARAEELWSQVEDLVERTRVASISLLVPRSDAILAIVNGNLEDALELARRFIQHADAAGAPVRGRQFGVQLLLIPALHLGRADIYLSAFEGYARLVPSDLQATVFVMLTAARAICLANLGHMDEARTLAGPLLDDMKASDREDDTPVHLLAILLQVAVVLEHRAAAQALAARLECVAQISLDHHFYSCVGRHLGDAAVLVGDPAAARSFYLQALDAAVKIRFRPELALIHLRLAELLLDDADDAAQSEALEHLNVAIPELRDMKMQPALERGLSLMEQVGHRTPAPPASPGALAPHSLTSRETAVARLVAAGRSNREIAEALVISEGTVEVHVKHILSKLSLRSRAQVAIWFADQHPERGAERA